MNSALLALDGDDGDDADTDADNKIDWGWLIASLRVVEPRGHDFDETQPWPDGKTRPPVTMAEWKASCAVMIDRCFENRTEAREAAAYKIMFFGDLAHAEDRTERAAQAHQLLHEQAADQAKQGFLPAPTRAEGEARNRT